jgi:hypothetical protein
LVSGSIRFTAVASGTCFTHTTIFIARTILNPADRESAKRILDRDNP